MGISGFGQRGKSMKIRYLQVVGPLIVLSTIFVYGKDSNMNEVIEDMTKLEKYLKTAEILEVEIDNIEGRTAPWHVILDDGETTRQALFKYVNRPRPTHLPDSYHYEIAAYKLSKLLNYPVIPPVVEREIKETAGSLQVFLEGCFSLSQHQREDVDPPNSKKLSDDLSELAVFENLVFCGRNPEDVYIQAKDGKVWRVDFSEAFEEFVELDPENDFARCSKTLFQNLKKLKKSEIESLLHSHVNDEEINALLKRKDLIIDKIMLLIEEKGEDAVLF
jgi:hypothetical protein